MLILYAEIIKKTIVNFYDCFFDCQVTILIVTGYMSGKEIFKHALVEVK